MQRRPAPPQPRPAARPAVLLAALLLAVAVSTGCALPRATVPASATAATAPASESALLREIRDLTEEQGLAAARDHLRDKLRQRDGSRGSLESRVLRTTRDPELVLPDSLAALPPGRRARIALVMVPGTKAGYGNYGNRTRETLRNAAEQAREMGFDVHFIETKARGTIEENAAQVAASIQPVFESADAVLLVMLSRGAHDVIHCLEGEAAALPAAHRAKLAAVLSLAGTVQGSVVADWFAHSDAPLAASTRAWLRLSGQGDSIVMLETVARSPWGEGGAANLRADFPRLTWVSLAMLPDGSDGSISERLWAPAVRRRIAATSPRYSPNDGLVESAAVLLPDGAGVPEWVVAALGSHAVPNGRYLDGSPVAPFTTVPGRERLRPESGGEIMSAYLRALPRSLVD